MTGEMLVVAPDYHLAPEHPFPRGLEEAYQTLRWAKEHVEDYGGDPENLNVGGDSSGGNFAAVVSMMARERKGPDIKGQYLVYPLVCNRAEELTESEKRYGRGHFLEYRCTEDPMALYLPGKKREKIHTHPRSWQRICPGCQEPVSCSLNVTLCWIRG